MKPTYILFAVNKEDEARDLQALAVNGNDNSKVYTGYEGSYKGEKERSYVYDLQDVTELESSQFIATLAACEQESFLLVDKTGAAFLIYVEDALANINKGIHWINSNLINLGHMTEVTKDEATTLEAYTYQESNNSYYIAK